MQRGIMKPAMLLSLLVILLVACSGSPAASEDPAARGGALKVITTTGQIADAVRQVAGERVVLENLLGPGIDPHTYVATEGDIARFAEADIIFYNGLRLEAQLDRVLQQIGSRGMTVVGVGDAIEPQKLLNWEPEAGLPYDPHIWNDVELWQEAVIVVRDTLMQADPANAAYFAERSAAYLAQLDELDNYIQQRTAELPDDRRVLVTAHDAFGYFGRAYGFEVEAVQGISTEAEAGAGDIQALVEIIVSRQVPAIFIETTISPRTIEAVQAAVRSQNHEVVVGGQLYSDAMGEPGTGADTYIGMMRHNIDTIVAALGA
ncbi:MAG TPA: zinc ABC transporter substrate-binding protein [Roseiflexaceae bacterium]|nr:zinc ABC transporter substrate-binding protein [Roseiflexaceae bacterium]HMP41657.1 zinc ABC transporter substrate-binding protein [Roseiflexaceae bacterium]